MLGRAHRMRRSQDFRVAVRTGARAGSGTVVVHLALGPSGDAAQEPRIGFIVNKSVGAAVVRNRVRRQLRHLLRPVVADLPGGSLLVVRALPAAAAATGPTLAADVEACLQRVRRKADRTAPA